MLEIPDITWRMNLTGSMQSYSVSDYLLSAYISFGRKSYLDPLPVGTLSMRLLNSDNRFHPLNTGGPYYNSGTGFDADKTITLSALMGTWNNQLWTGTITDWTVDLSTDPTANIATVTAGDVWMKFRRTIPADGSRTPEWYNVRQGAYAYYIGGYTSVGGVSSYTYMNLAAHQYSQKTLASLIEETDNSTFGATWYAQGVYPTFVQYAPGAVDSASDALHFVPGPRTTTGEIPYHRISPLTWSPHLYNSVTLERTGGARYTKTDATSISRHGERPFFRSGMSLLYDADVETHAERFLAVHKDPWFGPSWVEVNLVASDGDVRHELTGYVAGMGGGGSLVGGHCQPGAACRVTAGAYTFECVIEGIDHIITSPLTWTVRYHLSPRIFYTDPL